jgi:hypothetical protein
MRSPPAARGRRPGSAKAVKCRAPQRLDSDRGQPQPLPGVRIADEAAGRLRLMPLRLRAGRPEAYAGHSKVGLGRRSERAFKLSATLFFAVACEHGNPEGAVREARCHIESMTQFQLDRHLITCLTPDRNVSGTGQRGVLAKFRRQL